MWVSVCDEIATEQLNKWTATANDNVALKIENAKITDIFSGSVNAAQMLSKKVRRRRW